MKHLHARLGLAAGLLAATLCLAGCAGGREESSPRNAALAAQMSTAREAAAPAAFAKNQGPMPLFAVPMAQPETARSHIYGSPFPPVDTERYAKIDENPIKQVAESPVSTFSLDVDTGSYANIRRFLKEGRLPPKDAVRVEEMVNYFPYRYALPEGGKGAAPFAVHLAAAPAPWNPGHVLLRIGIKGQDIAKKTLPPVNLVFLVDVSGSMDTPDKLPLLKSSLKLLAQQMRKEDRISLVTYAGQTAVVLSGAPGNEHEAIDEAIGRLGAGGSTAGAAGIELAYQEARRHFMQHGINRILLATDGDFNVGMVDFDQLKGLVERERQSGVSFSTLGFGTGNYNDQLMEQLADAGNGAYSYIDSLMEGKKVLCNEMTSTLATIAQDVKAQVEFNPATVSEYRLIGYEDRLLKREDFNNDKVDAGDIGAGHTVTVLYELTPKGAAPSSDPLRYAGNVRQAAPAARFAGELGFLKLRYKLPGQKQSRLIGMPIPKNIERPMDKADPGFRLAAAVAGFGGLLRGSPWLGAWGWQQDEMLAGQDTLAANDPAAPYRTELVQLIGLAQALSAKGGSAAPAGK